VPPVTQQQRANRVLVVDDEPAIRDLLARALRDGGFDALEADSAAAAIAVLERGDGVDLVLTDMVMPEADGLELSRQVARRWPALRVLYVSANAGRAAEITGADSSRILGKPFTPPQLVAFVRAHLP
jgi:two-component system, cell cycle sensor histidine kinase and response regulator CckA